MWQNSLGQNNLIYIATVLGDIKNQIEGNKIPHFAQLIWAEVDPTLKKHLLFRIKKRIQRKMVFVQRKFGTYLDEENDIYETFPLKI